MRRVRRESRALSIFHWGSLLILAAAWITPSLLAADPPATAPGTTKADKAAARQARLEAKAAKQTKGAVMTNNRGALSVPVVEPALYQSRFADEGYGQTPPGWTDLTRRPPARNWAVDGQGFLRVMLKDFTGVLAYSGALAGGQDPAQLSDVSITASFKKTEDPQCGFGLVTRLRDAQNHYLASFSDSLLELHKVNDGKPQLLMSLVTLKRQRAGQVWTLTLAASGELLSAVLHDEQGQEMARVDGRDEQPFAAGRVGLRCTTYAAVRDVTVRSLAPYEAKFSPQQVAQRNAEAAQSRPQYPVLKPHPRPEELNLPLAQAAPSYDVVVAGAGCGGWAAAVQAARLGSRVLLLEESDWIGGQMSAAAVTTMDESGIFGQHPVRERGIYREFHESMVSYYYTLDKDPFNAYYANPQADGGYEPRVTRAVLYSFLADAKSRAQSSNALDLVVRARVTQVQKNGDTVSGVTVEAMDDAGATTQKQVACQILIDATEYGDVIPLTGARYRVGNVTSDSLDRRSLLQDHTWTAVICEYPNGVPEQLKIKSPPPGYDTWGFKRYQKFQHYGVSAWGAAAREIKGPRVWRVMVAWRGMADTDSLLTGELSERRHTQCGLNGGNDYPVTVATVEEPKQRLIDEREGIHKTLCIVYYLQHELGLNWALDVNEGYDTPYNRWKMKQLQLRPDLEQIAVHMPQMPYVRESRRVIGNYTLVANDLKRYDEAKHFPTSVAMGDYFMDLHNTDSAIETDLDSPDYTKGSGPFQVPFEAFLPEKIDGFLPAEKNLSQSRLVSGATRLQPITMLTGQAAGTIAALAVKANVQPRQLDPKAVQAVLLESGSTLVQRWYSDVPWGSELWRATQLLSLHGVMDRPGPINREKLDLGSKYQWGTDKPLTAEELNKALSRLAELKAMPKPSQVSSGRVGTDQLRDALKRIDPRWAGSVDAAGAADPKQLTAGEFAVIAAKILTQSGQ